MQFFWKPGIAKVPAVKRGIKNPTFSFAKVERFRGKGEVRAFYREGAFLWQSKNKV